MGTAQRKEIPGGLGYGPESSDESSTLQSFNGIKAIQEHLVHIARLKAYLCARTYEAPEIPLTCYSECQVAQWSHSEKVRECANRKLLDSVCKHCEEFQELATQSVLLTVRNMPEPASEVVLSALELNNASKGFQNALAELHVECRLNQ